MTDCRKPQIAGSGVPGEEVQSSTAQDLSVRWAKYRGPGQVTLATPTAVVEGGKVATVATFAEPGLYVIQVTAYDGSPGSDVGRILHSGLCLLLGK